MSDTKMEQLKNKIKKTASTAVHSELIDTTNLSREPLNKSKNVQKKMSFNELHSRDTVYLENEIKERLDQLSNEGGKGTKTRIVNEALKQYLKNL